MVSKISIGGVQFGQDYGIANTRGQVPQSEVFAILNYAQSAGIEYLDTAFAYGESESVIGEYLGEYPNRFKIVSKLPPLEQYGPGKVEEFFMQSLQRLRIKQLQGYLLHRFKDILISGDLWNDLICMKKSRRVEKIGFSLYSPDELSFLLDKKIDFDMVQVPYSVFDRRFEKYFDLLNKKGIEIHARSVFLQGLAFLEADGLPAPLKMARPQLENLRQIAGDQKISVGALCLNFVLANRHIDKIIIGVDSLAQLQNNVAGIDSMASVQEVYGQLNSVKIEREEILLPYQWGIVGERIFLRPLSDERISTDYISWMQDQDVLQYLTGRQGGYSEGELKEYVIQMNKSPNNHLFGIFLEKENTHIGNIKIGNIDSLHKFADLGLIIGNKSLWGKGYATEAITLATEHAFNELHLNKLTAGMVVDNIGSHRAFIKAGYREVGRLKKHVLFKGRYTDTILVEKCRG